MAGGRRIWSAIEQAYPEVCVWETCTPWFDKRNIHFYINVCGFAAVEFFCARHPDPHMPDVSGGNGEDAMFRFVKCLRRDGAGASGDQGFGAPAVDCDGEVEVCRNTSETA